MSNKTNQPAVPDFTVTGFDGGASQLTTEHAQLKDVKALKLAACVVASYDASTNKICFTVPIFGYICITSPVTIPVSADLKACVETCGSLIPTGLKATLYLNGAAIYSGIVFGSC